MKRSFSFLFFLEFEFANFLDYDIVLIIMIPKENPEVIKSLKNVPSWSSAALQRLYYRCGKNECGS